MTTIVEEARFACRAPACGPVLRDAYRSARGLDLMILSSPRSTAWAAHTDGRDYRARGRGAPALDARRRSPDLRFSRPIARTYRAIVISGLALVRPGAYDRSRSLRTELGPRVEALHLELIDAPTSKLNLVNGFDSLTVRLTGL